MSPRGRPFNIDGKAVRYHRTTLTPGHSDLPISEIAAALGFPDPELFSKWFRVRTRMAPTKMRSKARETAVAPAPPAARPAPQPADGEPRISARDWRRIMLRIAPRESALALLSHLVEDYPDAFDEPLTLEETPCSTWTTS